MEKKKKSDCCCELCAYYAYDEESDAYLCEMDLDEDELAGLLAGRRADCPYSVSAMNTPSCANRTEVPLRLRRKGAVLSFIAEAADEFEKSAVNPLTFRCFSCIVRWLHGGCSSVGRAPDCGSGCLGFESLHPPH